LGDADVLMATSPKSNTGHVALDMALEDVRKGKGGDFPRHLQNMHVDTYTQEREQGYRYPHNYPNRWVEQQYLPDELVGTHYYTFGDNKIEQAAKHYWETVKGK
jgi:putative ATPase